MPTFVRDPPEHVNFSKLSKVNHRLMLTHDMIIPICENDRMLAGRAGYVCRSIVKFFGRRGSVCREYLMIIKFSPLQLGHVIEELMKFQNPKYNIEANASVSSLYSYVVLMYL